MKHCYYCLPKLNAHRETLYAVRCYRYPWSEDLRPYF